MTEQKVSIYTLNVDNEERKAIDLMALKMFLEQKKLQYSLLYLDPAKIDHSLPLAAHIAKAAIDTLYELEDAIDNSLGLKSQDQEVEDQEVEESSEPVGKVDLSADADDEEQIVL